MESCSIRGCPCEYEERAIMHLKRWSGQPVAVDHVPAKVCTVCGDMLFTGATGERLAALRQAPPEPTGAFPLYDFAEASVSRSAVAAARTG